MRFASLAIALTLALASCQRSEGEAEHAHGAESVVITHFTEQSEVFVEFPPLAAGARSPFALHLTALPSGRPIAEGRVIVRLVGPEIEETWEAGPSATPGIFRPAPIPQAAGERRLLIDIALPSGTIRHDLGLVTVYSTAAEADASLANVEPSEEGVSFLKEQQWRVAFATAPVETAQVRASVPARIVVRGTPEGEAAIAMPVSGRVETVSGFPHVGQRVRAGQTLFRVRPLGEEAAQAASVAGERARASADLETARADLTRAQTLHARGFLSDQGLEAARARVASAQGTLQASNAGLVSLGGTVRTPISGAVSTLSIRPGETASAGAIVARVVNPDRLLIEARVPERDASLIGTPAGVSIEPPGGTPILLSGADVRVLGAGRAIDPQTRTVQVAFETRGRDDLVIGMAASGRVFVGAPREALVMPRTAIVDDGGVNVVYVLVDGETFARRVVQLGASMGDRVEALGGVSPGERVVSTGAYLVRLAESGPAEAGHGHAH